MEGLQGDLAGCAVYYSPYNRPFGMEYSFECTFNEARVGDSYPRILEHARTVARALSHLLQVPLTIGGLEGWELSGRMFNLYKYKLQDPHGASAALRLVEYGGRLLGAYGALDPHLVRAQKSPEPGGEILGVGERPRLVFLEPHETGLPPGQKVVRRNPIYAVEGVQSLEHASWRLRVDLPEGTREYTLRDLAELAREESRADFHCVTGWTLRGRTWEGVPLRALLRGAPMEGWLGAVSSGGYASFVPLEIAVREGLLVFQVDGRPLTREEGAPARLFIPSLYGWKHVKWVTRLVVHKGYVDGYWEALGYHERGLASAVERFKIRNLEIAARGRLEGEPRPLKP